MGSEEGGPTAPLSLVFEKLVTELSKKTSKGAPPKFLKRIKEISIVVLPPKDTIQVVILLVERALIRKFIIL